MRHHLAQAAYMLLRAAQAFALVIMFAGISAFAFAQYPVPTNAPADYPAWWFQRGVITPTNLSNTSPSWPADYPPSDDYSAINQGQLKNLSAKAYDELQSQLPAAVLNQSNGVALRSVIESWTNSTNADNYGVVNQGQLKALAKKFYDVLGSACYTAGLGLPPLAWTNGAYPWTYSTNSSDNYAVANIGQAKCLFSFNLTAPPGQLPAWKVAYYSAGQSNGSTEWIQAYSTAVQAEIAKHQWNKAQADEYVTLQANNSNVLTTGLTIWFKADSGVINTNGLVTSWIDQTGNYSVIARGTNAPTFVTNALAGLPVVRFSGKQGLDNLPEPADPGLNSDITIITVVSTTDPWASQNSLTIGYDTDSRSLGYQGSQQLMSASGFGFLGWAAPSAGVYGIEAGSLDPTLTKLNLYRNGTLTMAGTIAGVTPLSHGICLGEKSPSSCGWIGDIAEVLVYDHQLSTNEMLQVTQYLEGKYGEFNPNASWPIIHSLPTHSDLSTSKSSPSMTLSMGLNGLTDYSTAQQFLNVMRYARVWQTHNAVNLTNAYGASLNGWSTGFEADIPADSNGWPTQIPFTDPKITNSQPDPNNAGDLLSSQQSVHTIVTVVVPGSYRVRFRGTGSFHLYGTGTNNAGWAMTFGSNEIAALPVDTNGMSYFDTPAVGLSPDGGDVPSSLLTLGIDVSSGVNYLHDIEIVTPGFADTNLTLYPFHPDYLATLKGYNSLRMMGWGNINSSPRISWSNRTRPTAVTQSQPAGVALEYMVMICNQLGENLWLNIPDQADQNYTRNAARLILNGAKADGSPFIPGVDDPTLCLWPPLNPSLKVYLEYSNETWNYSFPQAANVVARAVVLRDQQGLPFDSDNYKAGEQFTAYQAANIWQWFYEEWGTNAPRRLVRVMAGMMDTNISEVRLAAFQIPGLISVNQVPDALAIAPYFGGNVGDTLVKSGALATTTIAEVLQQTEADMTNNVLPQVVALRNLADKYGIWLNCYEAGQGLVATGDNVNNTNLTALLIGANRDPGMGVLYTSYLAGLSKAGVVEVTHAADMGEISRFGAWTVLDYLDQPLDIAYKYQALMAWISTNPVAQANLPPTISLTYPSSVVDISGVGSASVPLSTLGSVDYDDTIASASWSINGTNYPGATITPTLPVGTNTITATVSNSHGVNSSQSISITVRPHGSDTVLVQSDFSGTAPGQSIPWTNTSMLSPGISFGGWSYPSPTNVSGIGLMGVDGGTTNNNAFGVNLDGYGGLPEHRVSLADAVNYHEYLSCTIIPNPGQSLDLRGAAVSWILHSFNSNSAEQCSLMTSISGFSVGSQVYQSAPFNATGEDKSDTFSTYLPFTSNYANITGPLEFRIYLAGNCFSDKPVELTSFKLIGALQ